MNIKAFSDMDPLSFLNRGDVFYMEHHDVDGIHYMVVLNAEPQSNEVIVLGVLTTKVEKRKAFFRSAGKSLASLVEFDYLEHSAVDCNDLKEISKDNLCAKIESGLAKISNSIPDHISRRIFDGIILGDAPQRLKNIVQNLSLR